MFEAYSVGIKLSLTGNVISGLGLISRQFMKTHKDAKALQRELSAIKLTLLGAGLATGAGVLGFSLIGKAVRPAAEYAAQLNRMRIAGLSNKELAEATALAWKNASDVMTTMPTQNLKVIMDLKNVLGSMSEARTALPIVTQMGTVLGAARGNVASGFESAYAMAKALDVIGAAASPGRFIREATMMSKSITAFQGRVTPEMFQSAFAYARQAKFDLSDRFKYEFLPTLMLEYAQGSGGAGGGSRGVGPMLSALYRVTNQGYIARKALPLWENLGLVRAGTALRTGTSGTIMAPLLSRALAADNPFLWATQVLDPAIRKKFGKNIDMGRERQLIGEMFRGNQLAASITMEFITKQRNFLRDQAILLKADPYSVAYRKVMKNDPNAAYFALQQKWQEMLIPLGNAALPLVITGTEKLTYLLRDLGNWFHLHPLRTKGLVDALGVLSGALAFKGVVLGLAGAFDTLKLAMAGSAAAGGGAAGGGAAGGAAAGGAAGLAARSRAFMARFGVLSAIWGVTSSLAEYDPNNAEWVKQQKNIREGIRTGRNLGPLGYLLRDTFGAFGGGGEPKRVGGSPYVPTQPTRWIINLDNYMDGSKVTDKVLLHLNRGLSRPMDSTTSFDPTMHVAPVAAPY